MEAATTLFGSITVFGISFIKIDWKKWGNVAIICTDGLSSLVLYIMGITTEIWLAYGGYLIFRTNYQILMTIASFEIVKHLPKNSMGLVFGFNTFTALGCQTILTFIVNNQMGIDPKPQFVIYAVYFFIICMLFVAYQIKTNSCLFGAERTTT